jgi:hypothetical protein
MVDALDFAETESNFHEPDAYTMHLNEACCKWERVVTIGEDVMGQISGHSAH